MVRLRVARRLSRVAVGVALLSAGCSAFIPEIGGIRGSEDAGVPVADASDARAATDAGPTVDAAPVTVTVTVAPNDNHVFSPSNVTLRVGDTVHWVWAASGHTVTSGTRGNADGKFCSPSDGPTCSSTPTSQMGATYDHTFGAAGTFPYFCRPHAGGGMTGTVIVQ